MADNGEFRRVAEHLDRLGLNAEEGPASWREARDIDEDAWFEHLRFQSELLEGLIEAHPENAELVVQGLVAGAIQWGFEMAVLRYGSDVPREGIPGDASD